MPQRNENVRTDLKCAIGSTVLSPLPPAHPEVTSFIQNILKCIGEGSSHILKNLRDGCLSQLMMDMGSDGMKINSLTGTEKKNEILE